MQIDKPSSPGVNAAIDLQNILATNPSAVEKLRAVVKYVNQFSDVKDRSEIICDIIKAGNFLNPMNATGIASLAAKCQIDDIGVLRIADNIYGSLGFNPARDRFIGFCEIEKINVDQYSRRSPGLHFYPIEEAHRQLAVRSPTVGSGDARF